MISGNSSARLSQPVFSCGLSKYPLVNKQFAVENGPVEIVDLCWFTVLKICDVPVRYVTVYQRVHSPEKANCSANIGKRRSGAAKVPSNVWPFTAEAPSLEPGLTRLDPKWSENPVWILKQILKNAAHLGSRYILKNKSSPRPIHPSTIIHPSFPHSRDLVSETGKVSQVLPMALGSPVVMLSALCCRKPGGGAV